MPQENPSLLQDAITLMLNDGLTLNSIIDDLKISQEILSELVGIKFEQHLSKLKII